MAESPPRFRLLLHGQDGSIPYLTPELTRLVFCPEEASGVDADGSADEDWAWRRRHFVLGVAVKDTCVAPVYREAPPPKKKKRKHGGGDGGRAAKRVKKDTDTSSDGAASASASVDVPPLTTSARGDRSDGAASTSSNGDLGSDEGAGSKPGKSNAKKPCGYTFLDHSQSSQICTAIRSHLNTTEAWDKEDTSNYMQTHLRIPPYISTVIVPTFSLDSPENSNDESDDGSVEGGDEANDKKKYAPTKQSSEQKTKKQQQQQQKNDAIPNSTKNAMPLDTPHGWQKIGPEQYCDAVLSLALPTSTGGSSACNASCEGAVGLFDHLGMDRNQASASSIQRLVTRIDDWSRRTQNCHNQKLDASMVNFWTPVHLAASHLPSFTGTRPPSASESGRVAIVGWDAVSYSREHRRKALGEILTTTQYSEGHPRASPKQCMVLSVNDLPSILDAAKAGASIVGTDLVRQWSRSGKALCLDLTLDDRENGENEIATVGGMMDLTDERYARDALPILPGCKCMTCKPRRKSQVPSFTRAYIHHLIKAKEMLAETLLFLHNLHQTLLVLRRLSEAASLDESEGGKKGNLEALYQKIEEQL